MNDNNSSELTTTIVICCYSSERIDWLVESVNSIFNQNRKPDEVIVVFDRKSGLEKDLRDSLPLSVKIMPNKSGIGLSNARNSGMEAASGDVIIFLDDDAVAEPAWLEHLVSSFSDSRVVGVGGKAVPEWVGSGKRPGWFPEEIDWTVGCMHPGFGETRRVVRNVFGCNMAFRKTHLCRIGGFDSRLGGPISGDDTDICLRITQIDTMCHIIYEPAAVIHHKVPEKRQTFRHIFYNAWIQGVGKAVTRSIHLKDNRALASEKGYLGSLLFKFLPGQLLYFFKHPRRAAGRIAAVFTVITSIGLGYILTRTKLHRVNLNQYKTT